MVTDSPQAEDGDRRWSEADEPPEADEEQAARRRRHCKCGGYGLLLASARPRSPSPAACRSPIAGYAFVSSRWPAVIRSYGDRSIGRIDLLVSTTAYC